MSDKIKIKSPKEVGKIISSLRAEGMTDGSIRELLLESEREFELNDKLFERALDLLLSSRLPNNLSEDEKLINITQREYDFISQIQDVEVRLLFTILLYCARENWHPTGWIKYDERMVMELGDFKNHKRFLEITQRASKQGLDFRVVGSKNPILCFKLNWFDEDSYDVFTCSLSDLLRTFGEER